jgi:N-acetyl sugar amidotransferase
MICSRCVYDDTIPYIHFDSDGVCNYCHQHDQLEMEYRNDGTGIRKLQDLAEKIRKQQKHKQYDVVVGVSGGTDSSYLLHLTKEIMGLRPLAVHFDNTWNSGIAVENIKAVTDKLGIDLYTVVADNHEFNDIFRSFIKASVPDIDTPSDIALATVHYMACQKFGIRHIFEGHSFRTEGISPHGWFYMDARYIASVHKTFGQMRMKTYPNLWMHKWLTWIILYRIKKVRPLYYIDYQKQQTRELLSSSYGWQPYGGHHMENYTSYFTNNYWLPKKFGYDLRICEYSALVRSGQLSRDEALDLLKQPKTLPEGILTEIRKRLGFSVEEFDFLLNQPNKSFRDYKTYKRRFEKLRFLFFLLSKANLVPMSFYLKYTKKYPQ